jgi:mono/diheme cytochrome c family protein
VKFVVRACLQSSLVCAVVGCAVVAFAMMQPPSSVSAGSKAEKRGAELFATRGCAHCHGPAGVGGAKGPDLQLVRKRLNKVQIRQQIHDGGKVMPEFGDVLTLPQIEDLVAYLHAKRKVIVVVAKASAAAPRPAAAESDSN